MYVYKCGTNFFFSPPSTILAPITVSQERMQRKRATSPRTERRPLEERRHALVMLCSADTEDEVFARRLCGMPSSRDFLSNELLVGKPIILFNISTGVAHVNIIATSGMSDNIEPGAFGGSFNRQIKVDVSKVGWVLCDHNIIWKNRMRAGTFLTKQEYMKWYNRVPWEEAEWLQKKEEQ